MRMHINRGVHGTESSFFRILWRRHAADKQQGADYREGADNQQGADYREGSRKRRVPKASQPLLEDRLQVEAASGLDGSLFQASGRPLVDVAAGERKPKMMRQACYDYHARAVMDDVTATVSSAGHHSW